MKCRIWQHDFRRHCVPVQCTSGYLILYLSLDIELFWQLYAQVSPAGFLFKLKLPDIVSLRREQVHFRIKLLCSGLLIRRSGHLRSRLSEIKADIVQGHCGIQNASFSLHKHVFSSPWKCMTSSYGTAAIVMEGNVGLCREPRGYLLRASEQSPLGELLAVQAGGGVACRKSLPGWGWEGEDRDQNGLGEES